MISSSSLKICNAVDRYLKGYPNASGLAASYLMTLTVLLRASVKREAKVNELLKTLVAEYEGGQSLEDSIHDIREYLEQAE